MDFPGPGDTVIEFIYNTYRRDEKLAWAPAGYTILATKWLIKNNLEPARIYGFHDRGFATMKQVRQILDFKRS